ncbi:MAG: hypothetical protein IJ518_03650 [Clostridia bacterium]|nr:hypothetical protein [Clostridia bacterium]
MPTYFEKAQPVWLAGLETERHITAGFYTAVTGTSALLRVATAGLYRVFVNGVFVTHGPARCAHGFYRVDEAALPLTAGVNHIAIEVVNYYMNSFAYLMQPGFIQMELVVDGAVQAATGTEGFTSYQLTDRVRKMQRYSYQRPMGESYLLAADVYGWRIGQPGANAQLHPTAVTEEKAFVPRGIAPLQFPVCRPETWLSAGTFITGVKPEHYKKDRSLTHLGDPEEGRICGWPEDELELHLSDELQEWQITGMATVDSQDTEQMVLTAGQFAVLALPVEKTGFIAADILCQEDGTLYVAFDEELQPNGDVDPNSKDCLNALRLDMQAGSYPFQTMEPYGFRYIRLSCTTGAFTVCGLRVVEVICPQPITAAYTGDDPALARVFAAAVETFKQNAVDIFMDCPTRERAGWLCDSFFTARAEHALTGDNAIERNYLENYLLPERFPMLPEGMLPMCYPSDFLAKQYIPNWAMWFVLELEDYVRRNGDSTFVQPFRDRVYALLRFFEGYENADGLLEKLDSWVFVEWSQANRLVQDINFPTNMLYARMLRAVATLFDDPGAAQKAARLEDVIRRRSFDGQFFTDNEVYNEAGVPVPSGERTETCQYYAFFTGIATPETYPELWQRMLTEFGPQRAEQGLWPDIWPSNAFIGNFLRLELLRRVGLYDQLLSECVGYFSYMAERTGTLWENITNCASCNHGFASYAAVFILEAEKQPK